MKFVKTMLTNLSKKKQLRRFKTIFETMDGIIFGAQEVTVGAPHIKDNIEIKRYMSFVIIALLPTAVASIVFYGWHAVFVILASYIAGGIVEVAFAIIRKRHIEEGFLVTGLIFPLVLPSTLVMEIDGHTYLWIAAVGSAFGTFFGKEMFGGTGRNIFNPALVGRLFITIAFPSIMSARFQVPPTQFLGPVTDMITSATPLKTYFADQALVNVKDLLLGTGLATGAMGETFRIGIIAGGLFLIATKVASSQV